MGYPLGAHYIVQAIGERLKCLKIEHQRPTRLRRHPSRRAFWKCDSYEQAHDQFKALLSQIEADAPAVAPLLEQLWKEYISVKRSADFWQVMSDAEKGLSEQMSATNIQLKQNYMRLIQEQ